MRDMYDQAAEDAGVPEHLRDEIAEEVRTRTRKRVQPELVEDMHAALMARKDRSSKMQLAHVGARPDAIACG